MPNGKIGDHPFTDILVHHLHPLPLDMEEMIRKLHAINPEIIAENFDSEPFDWEQNENLEEGREKLKKLLSRHKHD